VYAGDERGKRRQLFAIARDPADSVCAVGDGWLGAEVGRGDGDGAAGRNVNPA